MNQDLEGSVEGTVCLWPVDKCTSIIGEIVSVANLIPIQNVWDEILIRTIDSQAPKPGRTKRRFARPRQLKRFISADSKAVEACAVIAGVERLVNCLLLVSMSLLVLESFSGKTGEWTTVYKSANVSYRTHPVMAICGSPLACTIVDGTIKMRLSTSGQPFSDGETFICSRVIIDTKVTLERRDRELPAVAQLLDIGWVSQLRRYGGICYCCGVGQVDA